jgi:hypothetical protein
VKTDANELVDVVRKGVTVIVFVGASVGVEVVGGGVVEVLNVDGDVDGVVEEVVGVVLDVDGIELVVGVDVVDGVDEVVGGSVVVGGGEVELETVVLLACRFAKAYTFDASSLFSCSSASIAC